MKFAAQQCSRSAEINNPDLKPNAKRVSVYAGPFCVVLNKLFMKSPDNLEEVFRIFKKNYQLIPLEMFANNPYKILVSTLLSSRTKDNLTQRICIKLFKKAPNIIKLNQLNEEVLEEIIYPVGFYRTKAKHLKALARDIIIKYKGKIPNSREDLMSLPGVGRKTANLVLNRAFNLPAISVDTHVHRITNILGWVNTKTPEETERKLMNIIPKKYWADVNRLFVSIGQQYRNREKLIEFFNKEGITV